MGIQHVSVTYNTPMHLQVFTPLYTQARISRGGDLHSANQINKQKNKKKTQNLRKSVMNQSWYFVYFLRIRSPSLLFKNCCCLQECRSVETETTAGTQKRFLNVITYSALPSPQNFSSGSAFSWCVNWRIADSSSTVLKTFTKSQWRHVFEKPKLCTEMSFTSKIQCIIHAQECAHT